MIHCIVVVYNRQCADSKTCKCLMKEKSDIFDVLIFDNSENDYGNREFCQQQGWIYLGGSGNQGLSKAYNQSVSYFIEENQTGYICLFDDDTALEKNYFQKLQAEIALHKGADILLPVLRQKEKIISPCRLSSKGRYFESVEECTACPGDQLQAFNSGMIIKSEVFRNYRYDERIFLDGIDHAFLRDMRKDGKSIAVIPLQCEQEFSGGQRGTVEGMYKRFCIYAKDTKILYENSPATYWILVGKRALHLCLMYKKIRFMKVLFQK